MKEDKKFREYVIKDLTKDSGDIYDRPAGDQNRINIMAIMYKYLGQEAKYSEIFEYIGNRIKNWEPYNYSDGIKNGKSKSNLVNIGNGQLSVGIWMNLSHVAPDRAANFFKSAARCCTLPVDMMSEDYTGIDYKEIANGKLWLGYALVMLGRYDEAFVHLSQVVPYFRQYKKGGPD